MKGLLWAVFFVCFIPFLSFADEVDKGLPADTPSKIKESARQVIHLGVEPDTVIKMTKTMISDSFTEQQIISGHELLIKAKKQNIDEESIINKLHEGIAKNVAAESILQAMEKVRARYELAKAYTQSMKTNEEQAKAMAMQMAECMAAGMDKSNMNKIVEMLQQKTKNVSRDEASKLNEKTLETATTMARSGVDSKAIVEVMNNALKRNYSSGQMEKLGNTFLAQARGSYSASELAMAYSDAIKNGATPERLKYFNPLGMSSGGGFAGGGAPPGGGGIAAGGPHPGGGGIAAGGPPPGGSGIAAGGAPPGAGGASSSGGGIGAASVPQAPGGISTGAGGAPAAPASGPPGSPPPGGPPGGAKK
jgi:hypothetical protein